MMDEAEVRRRSAGLPAARAAEMRLEVLFEDRMVHTDLARQLHQVDPPCMATAIFVAVNRDLMPEREHLSDRVDR